MYVHHVWSPLLEPRVPKLPVKSLLTMVPRSAKTHEPGMVVWDTVVELSAYAGAMGDGGAEQRLRVTALAARASP